MPLTISNTKFTFARALAVAGAAVYLVGCATPNNPAYPPVEYALRMVSRTTTPGWSRDVWVHGDTAYVADDEQGLSIYDVSNLSSPRLLRSIPTAGAAKNVRREERYNLLVFSENRVSGLAIDSLSLQDTVSVDFVLFQGNATELYARAFGDRNLLVVEVDRNDGFRFTTLTYDTTFNPPWIQEGVGQVWPEPRFSPFRGFAVDSSLAYVTQGQMGVKVFQMDFAPGGAFGAHLLGRIDTPGAAYDADLTADGRLLVVADYQFGIQTIDVTDPSNLTVLGGLVPPKVDEVFRVWVVGDTAYFLDQYNGIFAADISDPWSPRLMAHFDTTEPSGLFVTSDHTIFLADIDGGLYILRWN